MKKHMAIAATALALVAQSLQAEAAVYPGASSSRGDTRAVERVQYGPPGANRAPDWRRMKRSSLAP